MHADDLVGALGDGGEFGDGNRRGVGAEDDFEAAHGVEVAEEFGLDLEALAGGFDDEVASGEFVALGDGTNVRQRLIALLGGELRLGDFAFQVLVDGLQAAISEALLDIEQHHRVPALGEHMGDTVAHGARADNAYGFDVHDFRRFQNGWMRVEHAFRRAGEYRG